MVHASGQSGVPWGTRVYTFCPGVSLVMGSGWGMGPVHDVDVDVDVDM